MITYEVNILCDGKDCHECITTDIVERIAGCEDAIFDTVKRHGWKTGEYSDEFYCPDCAKILQPRLYIRPKEPKQTN